MSYYIFGELETKVNVSDLNGSKNSGLRCGDYFIYFNEPIDKIKNVSDMLTVNGSIKYNTKFCFAGEAGGYDAHRIISPFGEDLREEFSLVSENREDLENMSLKHLEKLNEMITNLRTKMLCKTIRIFVVDGYDDNFEVIQCHQVEMIKDIHNQIIDSFDLDSKVYELL